MITSWDSGRPPTSPSRRREGAIVPRILSSGLPIERKAHDVGGVVAAGRRSCPGTRRSRAVATGARRSHPRDRRRSHPTVGARRGSASAAGNTATRPGAACRSARPPHRGLGYARSDPPARGCRDDLARDGSTRRAAGHQLPPLGAARRAARRTRAGEGAGPGRGTRDQFHTREVPNRATPLSATQFWRRRCAPGTLEKYQGAVHVRLKAISPPLGAWRQTCGLAAGRQK